MGQGRQAGSNANSDKSPCLDDHIALIRGIKRNVVDRETAVYARVSSQAQKPELKNQRAALETFCVAKGYAVDKWIEEIGGGLNFKRPKFLAMIDSIVTGQTERIVIAHKDRLSRFGFDLLKHLCESNDCEMVVMNTKSLSPQQEMVEDLMAITHCFSARLYGLRSYKQTLKKALEDEKSTPH